MAKVQIFPICLYGWGLGYLPAIIRKVAYPVTMNDIECSWRQKEGIGMMTNTTLHVHYYHIHIFLEDSPCTCTVYM